MPVTEVSADIRKKRGKEKVKTFLKRLIIILIIAVAALAAVITRPLWYPKLNGILSDVPGFENDSRLAEGNFPILVEGGSQYHLAGLDNGFCIIDDSRFFTYNFNGKVTQTSQHTFSNPILAASRNRALIYDSGGRELKLMSKYNEIYEVKTDYPILLARLGEKDNAAVVTTSDKFLGMLMVYDGNGNNIFNYGSVNRIIDVCFNEQGDGCYIATVGSKGGAIVSSILYYNFSKVSYDEFNNPVPVWQSDYIETFVLSVRLFGEDKIIVIGDERFMIFSSGGATLKNHAYERELTDFASSDTMAALIFDDAERRLATLAVLDGETAVVNEVQLDFEAIDTDCTSDGVYVRGRSGIIRYDRFGSVVSEASLTSDYEGFKKVGRYVFLLGYDSINRIDFS